MPEYHVTLDWKLGQAPFTIESYPREHTWTFSGGVKVTGTAAPEYKGKREFVNPEEAFVASLASCHMLTFLAMAAHKGLAVESYEDHPVGILEKDGSGKMSMTTVLLKPQVKFGGDKIPTQEEFERLNEKAHGQCFIANSVTTKTEIRPSML